MEWRWEEEKNFLANTGVSSRTRQNKVEVKYDPFVTKINPCLILYNTELVNKKDMNSYRDLCTMQLRGKCTHNYSIPPCQSSDGTSNTTGSSRFLQCIYDSPNRQILNSPNRQ